MPSFDDDIELAVVESTESEHQWRGRLSDNWSIGPVPNGGYSSALVVRALLQHTGCEVPLSLTTHFHRPTIAGADATITTQIIRTGRTATHADASLTQDGKVRLRCTGVFGAVPARDVLLANRPSDIPSPDECVPRDPMSQGLNMTLLDSLDMRLTPDALEPGGGTVARIDGWVRFRDGRPNDTLGLCLFADSFPPAIISERPETGWVPTLELTTHIRGSAEPGWIRGAVTTSNVHGRTVVEDVRLWDHTGLLVVEARQLALLRP